MRTLPAGRGEDRAVFADAARLAASWPLLCQEVRPHPVPGGPVPALASGPAPFGSVNLTWATPHRNLPAVPPDIWTIAGTVADEIAWR
jgi:hypothetical protein